MIFSMQELRTAFVLSLSLAGGCAIADESLANLFSYSGFGTAAVDRTDTNDAQYVRTGQTAGAKTDPYLRTDSNFGLQGTVTPEDWLSGTVQVLAVNRYGDRFAPKFEWAYLKAKPLDGLAVRAGKLALPTFLISDSRYIGYANFWLRPPNEVYGEADFDTYQGGDLTYEHAVGKYVGTIGVLAGRSTRSSASIRCATFGRRGRRPVSPRTRTG